MKKIVLISIILILISCKKNLPEPTELYNKYRESVTLIKNSYFFKATFDNGMELYYILYNGDPIIYTDKEEAIRNASTSYGSGFFISEKGEIATNNHVVFPDREAKLIGEKINEYFSNLRLEIQNEISDNKMERGKVGDYYNSYYSILEYSEKEKLQEKYHDLETENIKLDNLLERLSFKPENTKIEMISVFLGVIYDDTHVTSDSDFDECVPIKRSESESIDLAIIQLKNKRTPTNVKNFLSISSADKTIKKLSLNDNVYMIGFNHGFSLASTENGVKSQFTQGTITQDPDSNQILYSIPTLPGSSGSPIIDQWGNLVAVNFAKTSDFQGFSFGIPVEKLIGLYNGNLLIKTENIINNNEQETKVVENVIDFSNTIKLFLKAEESLDFNKIYTFYSVDLKRYWNLKYPSYSELESEYKKSWRTKSNSKNYIKNIEKINDSIYDLYAEFEFYNNTNNKTISIDSQVRFIFNEIGKIKQVYGIEKKSEVNNKAYKREDEADKLVIKTDESQIDYGKFLFRENICATCHNPDVKVIGPTIKGINKIYTEQNGNIVKFLKGESVAIVDTDPGQIAIMKANLDGFVKDLTDEELAAIVSYIKSVE